MDMKELAAFKELLENKFKGMNKDIEEGGNGNYSFPLSPEEGLFELRSKRDTLQWVLEMMPHVEDENTTVIDLDKNAWNSIKESANKSSWMPDEYAMNDWVSDVCNFLEEGPIQKRQPQAESMTTFAEDSFPRFITLGQTAVRLDKMKADGIAIYHRDAGDWETEVKWIDGTLTAAAPSPYGPQWDKPVECQPCTHGEWYNSNLGYVSGDFPLYLVLGSSAVRLMNVDENGVATYRKDYGGWETEAKQINDVLMAAQPSPDGPQWDDPIECRSCTREEWYADNGASAGNIDEYPEVVLDNSDDDFVPF